MTDFLSFFQTYNMAVDFKVTMLIADWFGKYYFMRSCPVSNSTLTSWAARARNGFGPRRAPPHHLLGILYKLPKFLSRLL
jgi:hypothetical protein